MLSLHLLVLYVRKSAAEAAQCEAQEVEAPEEPAPFRSLEQLVQELDELERWELGVATTTPTRMFVPITTRHRHRPIIDVTLAKPSPFSKRSTLTFADVH